MAALAVRTAAGDRPRTDAERRQFRAGALSRRAAPQRRCGVRFPAVARHPDPPDGGVRAAQMSAHYDRHRRGDGGRRGSAGRVHGRCMSDKLFDRVALIGIGLIGSSLAGVWRRDCPKTRLAPCAPTAETLDAARRLDLADETTDDPAAAADGADLVVLATPLSAYREIAARLAPGLRKGAIVTDVGSVKEAVIRDVRPLMPEGVHFVPGHPVAGTEHSGPESGFAELFRDRRCILTPPPETAPEPVAAVGRMWESFGMHVVTMSADHHDKVLAMTSHLPHLIAYTIVGTATNLEESLKSEVIEFSASGFRDFTRIAASDPVMWRDIFLNNREAVLEIVQRFTEDLTALQRAIRWGEADTLEARFTKTRSIRRSIIEAKQA